MNGELAFEFVEYQSKIYCLKIVKCHNKKDEKVCLHRLFHKNQISRLFRVLSKTNSKYGGMSNTFTTCKHTIKLVQLFLMIRCKFLMNE